MTTQGLSRDFIIRTLMLSASGLVGAAGMAPARTFHAIHTFCSAPNCADGSFVYGGVVARRRASIDRPSGRRGTSPFRQ
ncbi:MAG TPA: hypothetical protein VGF97_19695 [Rhizomicrobium sp.]